MLSSAARRARRSGAFLADAHPGPWGEGRGRGPDRPTRRTPTRPGRHGGRAASQRGGVPAVVA